MRRIPQPIPIRVMGIRVTMFRVGLFLSSRWLDFSGGDRQ